MKKKIAMGLAVMITALLTGCGNPTMPLAEVFSQEQLEQQTKQIVEWLNAEEYEQVYETFREDMKEVLPTEELKAACEETYGNGGAFAQINDTEVSGQKIEGEDYAVVRVKAQYEKQIVTFQVGYDANMEVVGLYMK
ncbi:MAG: DUF3887 domain-containing protein [Acetatifactor sp.]